MLATSELEVVSELEAGREVRLWCASLDAHSELQEELHGSLSPDECRRAQTLPDAAKAAIFRQSRAILRLVLSRVIAAADATPAQLRFNYNRDGKPSLGGEFAELGIEFNLSHARSVVLIAVTQGRRVGVDVAWTKGATPVERIVRRFFSSVEREAFEAAADEVRRELFTRIWVRKEAYLKGRGEGISQWMYSTDFSRLPPGDARPAGGAAMSDQDRWELRDVAGLPPEYVGSVALERRSA